MAEEQKLNCEDWIIGKAFKRPESLPYILQHVKAAYFLDKNKKDLFSKLVAYHEVVPKVDMYGNPCLDSSGQPVTENRYSPRLPSDLDSSADTFEYLTRLGNQPELSSRDLNTQIKALVSRYQVNNVKLTCSKGLSQINEANVEKTINEIKENLDYIATLEVEEPLISQKAAVESHRSRLKDLLEKDDTRIETGLAPLDYLLGGGLMPGNFLVIASGTGQGKSMLAGQLMVNFSELSGKKIGVFGLEMDEDEYAGRQISYLAKRFKKTGMSQSCLSNPTKHIAHPSQLDEMYSRASKLDIVYLRKKQITIPEMKKYFKYMLEKGVEVFFLDHVLLVDSPLEERIKVNDIVNFMKTFAAENNVLSVAVSQMNRDTELSDPKVKDMSGGRAIEHAATALLTIGLPPSNKKRDTVLSMVNDDNEKEIDPSIRRLSLIKSRHSKSNTFLMAKFDGDNCIFDPIYPDNWESISRDQFNLDFKYEQFT